MNILMMTNTFTPHVGGVARSVLAFTEAYRARGHRVLVVAPEFENMPEDEVDVLRLPAIQRFNGSDFSVVLPIPGFLTTAVERFAPDLVHAHHPFLIGATALRVARMEELPLVFTHHTMYERYTHYVPGDSQTLKQFVINLSTNYANLCDRVIAPSESIAAILRQRQVTVPVDVIPTGVSLARFAQGDGAAFRAAVGIPQDAFVVGHLGRLAPEKNIAFLAQAVAAYLRDDSRAHVLVVGCGPSESAIDEAFAAVGLENRLHRAGVLDGTLLASAYHAMDVFAFASKSETQGMVLTEAMAAGVPVVALNQPGAREVVRDGENGRLLDGDRQADFVAALRWVATRRPDALETLKRNALATAEAFSMDRSAERALAMYQGLLGQGQPPSPEDDDVFSETLRMIRTEWDLLAGAAEAAAAALTGQDMGSSQGP